ncbi:MAG: response regulator transcription factor [Draconibacterium sp.]
MDRIRLNIAIIEPSEIIYEGLSNILLRNGDAHYSIYHFENLEEVFQKIRDIKIDLVIVNPYTVKNGVKSFSSYKKTGSHITWVALIYSFFEREIIDSFDAVIQITDSPETISGTLQNLVSLKYQDNPASREQLSHRETDVLKLLVRGLSNKEIADQLNISVHTVVSHRKNIVQKTGIKSQSGLTIYAISNNIINIEDYQE